MKLSNVAEGKDNNFSLIRIAAALAVLISHSFALAIGTADAEPLAKSLGITLGEIAVDVFFITSGFLVTASLLRRQTIIKFVWARVLRIYPALLVMLFLTVFVLGVFFTSLPLSSYFSDSKTHIYLAKCSTLFTGVAFTLPGVFEGNPFKNAVNNSLWILPYLVRMYAILVAIWVALQLTRKSRLKAFKLAIVSFVVGAGVYVLARHFYIPTKSPFPKLFLMFFYAILVAIWVALQLKRKSRLKAFKLAIVTFVVVGAGVYVLARHFYIPPGSPFPRLFLMFFMGAAFFVLKEYITLSRSLFWFFMIILSLAICNKHAFFVVYIFTIGYILFYVAYIPSGHIRQYNKAGDYSYGAYIYAFPVQQSIAALIPGVSVLQMILISSAATMLLAAFSWHLLERRMLGLKR